MPIALDADLPYLNDALIVVDSRADEAAWRDALVVEDWVTYFPAPGGQPTVRAEARLLCDHRALYVHYRVEDPEPERVRARLTRRDGIWGDDWAGIYLDPSGEAQRAYLFLVNPFGVQADATRMAGYQDETSWDGQWESEGRLTDFGYEVEIRIPWRTVRHPARLQDVGIGLLRSSGRTGERASWPERDPDVSGIIVQENLLRGPGAVDEGWGLSVTPSLVFGWTDDGPAQERWGVHGLAPGVTARFDPSPAVAGLVTVNPDFSQVETDAYQVDVNRRYALYLDEKRPFFTEGREWFDGPYAEMVYTRSMNTPRYGARATVEAGGWTVAALHVLDSAPADTVSEGGGWGEGELGPEDDRHPTLDTALRVRKAVGGDSYVGMLYSDKTITGSGLANRVMALDGRLRLSDSWELEGAVIGSVTDHASGEQDWAPAGAWGLEHESRHWDAGAWQFVVHEDFRAENGYLVYSDSFYSTAWAGYRFYPSRGPIRRITLMPLNAGVAWRPSDFALRNLEIEPTVMFYFSNAVSLEAEVEREMELYEDTLLVYDQVAVELDGHLARWLALELGTELGQGPYYESAVVGGLAQVWGGLQLTPGRRTSVTVEGVWERLSYEGEEQYAGFVGRARLDLFATRQLWGRLVVDRSGLHDQHGAQALLAWEVSPGRAVYLGGGVDQDADDAVDWQVFSKFSWQWQR